MKVIELIKELMGLNPASEVMALHCDADYIAVPMDLILVYGDDPLDPLSPPPIAIIGPGSDIETLREKLFGDLTGWDKPANICSEVEDEKGRR